MTNISSSNKKVIIIVAATDFRDEEYFIPKQILENARVGTITASNISGPTFSVGGKEVISCLSLDDIKPSDYNAAVFVGGPGCLQNLDNERSYRVIREAISQNIILAAICISPVILAKAGVLNKKKATVWSSDTDKSPVQILEDNGAIYQETAIVQDGNIITGNSPDAASEFGNAVLSVLSAPL